MKLLALIVIVITSCVSLGVSASQKTEKTEIISAYHKLTEMRKSNPSMLRGGRGVMVVEQSEASKLSKSDIVLSFNGNAIYSVANLHEQVASHDPECSDYTVAVIREGKILELTLSPSDFDLHISDMNPIQLSQVLNKALPQPDTQIIVDSDDYMTEQHLKGRPFRTPNNKSFFSNLPAYSIN